MHGLKRAFAVIAGLALVATACGGDGTTATGPTGGGEPTKGGTAVFGAEQWPECLHVLTTCNFATWYHVTTAQPVLPKLMMIDEAGNIVPSPVLAGDPVIDPGPPFTITYSINPDAVWEDASPITSEDIDFTWKAVMNTTGSDVTSGYDKIVSIDTSDPKTAVIEFSEPVAGWYDLMGGGNVNGYLLKKAAFPDADPDKPDLADEFKSEIPFSAGPWVLESFSTSEAVLVRNDNYWGEQTLLDQVTFIPIEEQPQETAALLSGEVSVIFPQASNVSILDLLGDDPNLDVVSGPTNYGDAFWLNLQKAPFDDLLVRQAFGYAVDRQAIIDTIIKLNDPEAEILTCLPPVFPVIGEWCDPDGWSEYTYDPAKSKELLEQAGYDCSSVPCTKDGKELSVVDFFTLGNERRKAVGQLTQEKALEAGWDFVPTEHDATDLFTNILPRGDYQVAEYAGGATVDPAHTSSYACDFIPTKANSYGGTNTSFYCNPEADAVMAAIDKELDPAKRLELVFEIQTFLQDDFVALPLYPFVNITAWRNDKIAGPVGDWNQASYGTYYNMDQWFIPS